MPVVIRSSADEMWQQVLCSACWYEYNTVRGSPPSLEEEIVFRLSGNEQAIIAALRNEYYFFLKRLKNRKKRKTLGKYNDLYERFAVDFFGDLYDYHIPYSLKNFCDGLSYDYYIIEAQDLMIATRFNCFHQSERKRPRKYVADIPDDLLI